MQPINTGKMKHKCSLIFDASLLMQQFLHFLPFLLCFSIQHYPGGWQDWMNHEQHKWSRDNWTENKEMWSSFWKMTQNQTAKWEGTRRNKKFNKFIHFSVVLRASFPHLWIPKTETRGLITHQQSHVCRWSSSKLLQYDLKLLLNLFQLGIIYKNFTSSKQTNI